MIRAFDTHKIRKVTELSDSMWTFHTLSEKENGKDVMVTVPSCWESYPDTVSYRGKASYRRSFQAGGNVRLEFKGVSHTAQVFVDRKCVASHYNAYTIFDVVLPQLTYGDHELEVIADNSFGSDSALHVPNDYQSYGGISRAVVLEELGDVYIKQFHFTPIHKGEFMECQDSQWFGKAEFSICNLSNQRFEGEVRLKLKEDHVMTLPVTLQGGQTVTLTSDEFFCGNVKEWSPENPNLYFISAELMDKKINLLDDLIDRIGFREIRTEGKDLLLNGKRLFLKGLCRHEDHPQFGCALPLSAMQYDLMLVKDLGANSIRTSHYPNDELFLDLCDEQGILIWEENHARGLSEESMRNPHFKQQCADCIREMIGAHYNHPSIYIWGILNECASHTEYGRECYQEQYDLIRELDPYRPRSSASCQFKTDLCLGYPEVVSYNIYPKWYHDTPVKEYLKDLYDWVQTDTQGSKKPFLITEIGAGAIYGYRTPTHVKWSEEYQMETLEEQIKAVLEHEGCSGIYIWQFCDVRVCDSWFCIRPKTMNNKGVVDEYRRPKMAYEIVKKLYHTRGNYVD